MEYRWEVWKAALKMEDSMTPGRYQELLQVENQWTRLIEIDIPRTFPEMPLFDKEQQQSLLRILHAYTNLNPDVGYCQGMNFVGGLLLLVAQKGDFRQIPQPQKEEEAFWMFVCLMNMDAGMLKLQGFYRRRFPLLRKYLWAFDELVAAELPDLQEHFLQENVEHAVYLHQWFLTLFINCLPMPMVLVFWDVIVCSGLERILTITVALLKALKEVLLSMQFEDIIRFFKTLRAGEKECNSAAIGQLVVSRGSSIGMPDHVAAELKAPLRTSPRSSSRTLSDDGDEPEGSTGADAASAGGLDGIDEAPHTVLGNYFKQFGDLPQGVLSWWEEAKDNLQRAGLSTSLHPPSRLSTDLFSVGARCRTVRLQQQRP